MLNGKLTIDGQEVPLSADFSLRFSSNPLEPVLYKNGKRVTREWHLELFAYSHADEFGGNANTE